jgi:2'-5' RNA ligase
MVRLFVGSFLQEDEVAEEKLNGIKELLRREVEFLKTGIGVEDGPIPADRPTKKYSSDGLGKKISIEFEYDYLEAWPQVTEARVLVATPNVVPDAVLKIGMALRRSMADQGLTDKAEPRNRLFRPHLTIARFNPAISFGDGKMLAAISEVLPVRHKIDRINLIKSHLGQGPGDYEIIDTVR